VTVPATAAPGSQWVSAEGRHSGLFAQPMFTVNTNWAPFRDGARHRGLSSFENVLNPGNVGAPVTRVWGLYGSGGNWHVVTPYFIYI